MELKYKQQEENNAQLLKNYNDVLSEVKSLRAEVRKQNTTISKILKILDSIDHGVVILTVYANRTIILII